MRRSRRPSSPLENPAFRRWFGDSIVVDEDGEPLVVYHGSNAHVYSPKESIEVFYTSPTSGRAGAFFSSDRGIAKQYGERVYELYLRIENPLVVDADGAWWTNISGSSLISGNVTSRLRRQLESDRSRLAAEADKIAAELADFDSDFEPDLDDEKPRNRVSPIEQTLDGHLLRDLPSFDDAETFETDDISRAARRLGFDGAVILNVVDSPTRDPGYKRIASDVFVVFDPRQIKSATNNDGAFDPDSVDIRKNPARTLSSDETANEYDRGRSNDFLTGGCLDWAQAYIDHVGGTLIGVFVNGSMEHVMVKDGKFVVDAVGIHRPSAVVSWFKKSWKTKDVKLSEPRSKDLRLLETDDERYADAFADVYNEYNQDPRFRG